MSLEPLPLNLEQGISRYAHELHISRDEAIRELLATALEQVSHPGRLPGLGPRHKSEPTKPDLEIADMKSIIGMFPNDPEFDKTMDAVIAARAERYAIDR
jgi:hypothetical protein